MAVKSYVPSFGYPVTRPYPYKWFPWVVLVGGIFSLVLFSAINLAANGYELKVQYTADPNSTVSQAQWAERWPFSWFSRVETACQSQTLQVNSQFYTDKLSLPYMLTSVWQIRMSAENHRNVTLLPSLRYTNNVLENCTVPKIVINFNNRNPETMVHILCCINNDDTPTWFNLTTTFTTNDASFGDYLTDRPLFMQIDIRSKASLWWGQNLLDLTDLLLRQTLLIDRRIWISDDNLTERAEILVGGIFWVYSDFPFGEEKKGPISSPLFFYEASAMTCATNESDGVLSPEYECGAADNLSPGYLDRWPDIFPEVDRYAKVLHSTILADLGSSSVDNILTNASLLQEYTRNFTDGIRTTNQSYDELKNSGIGPLEITPSTIYAEYFCQVPQRKPVGPLIVAIFVADLVFLQAVYKILTWTTTAWTERNNQQAKCCEGCLAIMERGSYELGLAAPTDAAQESLPASSETLGRLARRSTHERHRPLESQQSLVLSPTLSE